MNLRSILHRINGTPSLSLSLPLLLLGALLALYQGCLLAESDGIYRGAFYDFVALDWVELQGCGRAHAPEALYSSRSSLGTFQAGGNSEGTRCRSVDFELITSQLELEIADGLYRPGGRANVQYAISLKSESGQVVWQSRHRVSAGSPLQWRRLPLSLPPPAIGSRVHLELSAASDASAEGWIALRNRVNFYRRAPLAARMVSRLLSADVRPLIRSAVMLALALVLAALSLSPPAVFAGGRKWQRFLAGRGGWFLLLFLTAAGVHFRSRSYIYFDEWHVLERYSKLGIRGVIYTHNEHFLPLFFALYYLEALLFGDRYYLYLLLSALMHAANAFLLSELIERLGFSAKPAQIAARVLAMLFLINSLQSETLHWAFEQSLLGSIALTLLAALAAWDYLARGGLRRLFAAGICCSLAPLFFGNGFSAPALLGLLCLFRLLSGYIDMQAKPSELRPVAQLKRAALVIGLSGIMMLAPAALYILNKDGAGHGLDAAAHPPDFTRLGQYLFVGSQFGTVLRGLGIFPTLEPGGAASTFEALQALPVFALLGDSSALLFFALCGVGASLLLFFFAAAQENRRQALLLWLCGQLAILSSLMLPAFGRWHLGVEQSLSLRYHYGALIGLVIALLPAATAIAAIVQREKMRLSRPLIAVAVVFYLHLQTGFGFTYFTDHGERHRLFTRQLVNWQAKTSAISPGLSYEAAGTPLAGLQPLFPETITPGRHPHDIAAVLAWLQNKDLVGNADL